MRATEPPTASALGTPEAPASDTRDLVGAAVGGDVRGEHTAPAAPGKHPRRGSGTAAPTCRAGRRSQLRRGLHRPGAARSPEDSVSTSVSTQPGCTRAAPSMAGDG
jgi:hypothetical protein